MTAVFAAGLMPWPKHFSLKIFVANSRSSSRLLSVPEGGRPRIKDRAALTEFYSSSGPEYLGGICRVSSAAAAA